MVHAKWQAVEDTLTKHWYRIDIQAVKAQIACVAAHYITDYPPAWCMSIAPPGSAKTVVLESLIGLPHFHQIDEVTPRTFISGHVVEQPTAYADKKRIAKIVKAANSADTPEGQAHAVKQVTSSSLLNRIGPTGVITIPDFSTILQMREESRDNVFSQMRRIYDGSLRREFGTVDELDDREWKGRITALAAVTPEVDHYHKMFHALGDRWLRVRWARVSGFEPGYLAVTQTKSMLSSLQEAVKALLLPFIESARKVPELADGMVSRLVNLSELVCITRAHVHRDHDKEIDSDPIIESNTRLPQNLAQVARGWSALTGEPMCTEEAFALVERVAWDCMPPMRRYVLTKVRAHKPRYVEGMSANAVDRATDELAALGLVTTGDPELTELAQKLFAGIPAAEARIHVLQPPAPVIVTP